MATLVGVVAGLPIALWLNRRLLARGRRVALEDERIHLAASLSLVADALKTNALRLWDIAEGVAAGLSSFDPELDVATWYALRPDLHKPLRNPELFGRLAYHFERVATVERLIIKQMGEAVPNRDETLRSDIVRNCDLLTVEASDLVRVVEERMQSLDVPPFRRRIPTAPVAIRGRPVRELPESLKKGALGYRDVMGFPAPERPTFANVGTALPTFTDGEDASQLPGMTGTQ